MGLRWAGGSSGRPAAVALRGSLCTHCLLTHQSRSSERRSCQSPRPNRASRLQHGWRRRGLGGQIGAIVHPQTAGRGPGGGRLRRPFLPGACRQREGEPGVQICEGSVGHPSSLSDGLASHGRATAAAATCRRLLCCGGDFGPILGRSGRWGFCWQAASMQRVPYSLSYHQVGNWLVLCTWLDLASPGVRLWPRIVAAGFPNHAHYSQRDQGVSPHV